MKNFCPHNRILRSARLLAITAMMLALGATQVFAQSTWNGSVSTDMANPSNYSGSGNTRIWNGIQAGDLSLTATADIGGTFNYRAAQTGSVSVNGGGRTFINDINSTFLMEAGAGAVTWNNLVFVQGNTTVADRTFTFRNNSVNDLTFASSVNFTRVGGVGVNNARNLTFDGTGVIRVGGAIANMGNTATIAKSGSGVLVLSGTSSHAGLMALNAGTLRVGNNAALGSSLLTINAGTLASDSSTARTLTNAITMAGDLQLGDATGTGALTFSNINLGTAMRTFTVGNTATVVGAITSTGGLTKAGNGTLMLAASNSYTGTTAVNAGLLKVLSGGSISSSSTTVNNGGTLDVGGTAGNVQVNSGGLLKGSGSVGAFTLASGGTLTPGNSPGTLTAASAIVLGGSTYNWEISSLTGTAGTTWDLFSVGGLLDMRGVTSENKWNLVVTGDSGFAGWTGTNSYSYVFAQAASVSGFSPTVGTDVTSLFNITTSGIASKPNASFNANGDFKVVVGSANGFTTLNLMAVPEPSTGSMMGLGLAGLVVTRLLRRKSS